MSKILSNYFGLRKKSTYGRSFINEIIKRGWIRPGFKSVVLNLHSQTGKYTAKYPKLADSGKPKRGYNTRRNTGRYPGWEDSNELEKENHSEKGNGNKGKEKWKDEIFKTQHKTPHCTIKKIN